MGILSKRIDGTCVGSGTQTVAQGGGGPAAGPTAHAPVVIGNKVGRGGKNVPADVTTIQKALNDVSVADGGANPRLDPDGKCGQLTMDAIASFQLKQFGWSYVDSLVEPYKPTLMRLNQILGTGALPQPIDIDSPVIGRAIELARQWVNGARRHCDAAASSIYGNPSGLAIRATRLRLLNRHFDLEKFPDQQRVFQWIYKNIWSMCSVYQRPGGLWGHNTFQPDPLPMPGVFAFVKAPGGGFFRQGQVAQVHGRTIRVDSIYLCAPMSLLDAPTAAMVVVHELAHFVGYPYAIADHGYNPPTLARRPQDLKPNLKILNAENFANFVYESANHGKSVPLLPNLRTT